MPPHMSIFSVGMFSIKTNVHLRICLFMYFYGDLVYRFRKLVGKSNFSENLEN